MERKSYLQIGVFGAIFYKCKKKLSNELEVETPFNSISDNVTTFSKN